MKKTSALLLTSIFLLSQSRIGQALPSQPTEGGAAIDWGQVSLESFGGALESGSIDIPAVEGLESGIVRSWEVGDQIEDVLTAGDIESLGGQYFSLDQVSQLTGLDLGGVKIGDVPLLSENASLLSPDSLSNKGLEEISKTALSEVPELANLPIKDLAGWQDKLIAKIPGLGKIPLGSLPFSGLPSFTPLAKVNKVFGKAESNSTHNVISGGEKDKFSDPCTQKNCAYIELADIKGEGEYKGARWIVGGEKAEEGEMMGEGGKGILGGAFKNKEPVGRPLGEFFKLILTDTDETTGTATFGISTKYCKIFLGCTPFVFGPWEVGLQAKEGDEVFLGLGLNSGKNPVNIDVPKHIKDAIKASKKERGISDEPTSGAEGGPKNVCAQRLLSASPAANSTVISEVLKIGKDREFTEGQTGYLLAYAMESGSSLGGGSLYGHNKTVAVNSSSLKSLSSDTGRYEGLKPEAAAQWSEMVKAAKAAGHDLKIGDTTRTIEDQQKLFSDAIKKHGSAEQAAKLSAPPGHSEHHTGYAIDIRGSDGLLTREKDSAAYHWLNTNASQYGFEQSFTGGGSISVEDWHWRFIGSDEARLALGLVSGSGSIQSAIDTITEHVTKDKADFYGAGKALGSNDSQAIAQNASKFQALLDDCQFAKSTECDGKFINPMPSYVTSEFGMRLSPTYGTWRLHAGIDLSTGGGTAVTASCGGVATSRWESGYGNVVLIDHGPITSRYAHLASQLVSSGQTVSKGQPIGIEGNTGAGTGPHLHFELRDGSEWGTPRNPRERVAF